MSDVQSPQGEPRKPRPADPLHYPRVALGQALLKVQVALPLVGLFLTAILIGAAGELELGLPLTIAVGIVGAATVVPLYRFASKMVQKDRALFNGGRCAKCGDSWRYVASARMSHIYSCGHETRWFFTDATQ